MPKIKPFDYKKVKSPIQKVKIENPESIRIDIKETNKLLNEILTKKDDVLEISATLEIV